MNKYLEIINDIYRGLDVKLTPGGSDIDTVNVMLTKMQIAALLVLIEASGMWTGAPSR